KSETRSLKVFGGTLWGVTTERAEGLRWVRADRRKQVVWINEGDGEFFPRAATSVYATEGTNYIDYSVMTPDFGKEWMFKVEHRITRKFQVGPFQFRSGGRQVIYESAIMTNRQRPIP
ncbi:MAG: hypothetical protein ACXW32_11455, partial [Limisphaerales bacterium]